MQIKQIALGLMLFTSPAVANAAWRPAPAHHGPREPPPAPIEEHPRTRNGYIWTAGHHEWRHGHYVWISGRLVRVHRGQEWSEGSWDRHEDHWDWHPGGWRPHH